MSQKQQDGKVISAGSSFTSAVAMLTGNADLAAGTTAPAAKPNGQVAAAVSGAGYMFALQLFSKFVTFFANQLLLRLVSPAVFGVASIQCELLVSSVLFFAREPARLALLRAPIYDTSSTSALRRRIDPTKLGLMINLSWLPLAAGTPLALVLGYYWIHYLPVSELGAGYATAVQLYALGTLLDLAAEPLVALIVATTQLKARAIAEGVALTASCGTALALTWLSGGEAGILAFGWARVAFGLGYLCSYAAAVWWCNIRPGQIRVHQLLPSPIALEIKEKHITAYFDPASLAVAWSFVKQSVLKHFLTEGDKFVLSLFFTPRDQGIYALVFNYGSIVARLVFLPLEDAARLLFSRMAATDYRTTARSLLELALKFHLTLGLFAIVFGTQYSAPALVVLAGPQWLVPATDGGVINAYAAWGTAPVALAAYCWFIPVLGVNGILEAFVTATATPTDLHAQGYWLVGGAGVFAASAWLLYPLGATGLVVANAVHLLVRVVWAARYVRATCGERTIKEQLIRLRRGLGIAWWDSLLPARGVIYGLALAYVVAGWTRNAYVAKAGGATDSIFAAAQALAVGVGLASTAICVVVLRDYKFCTALWDLASKGVVP